MLTSWLGDAERSSGSSTDSERSEVDEAITGGLSSPTIAAAARKTKTKVDDGDGDLPDHWHQYQYQYQYQHQRSNRL